MLYCYFTGGYVNASTPWPVSITWQYFSGPRRGQSPIGTNRIDRSMKGSIIFQPVHYSDELTYGCTAQTDDRQTILGILCIVYSTQIMFSNIRSEINNRIFAEFLIGR